MSCYLTFSVHVLKTSCCFKSDLTLSCSKKCRTSRTRRHDIRVRVRVDFKAKVTSSTSVSVYSRIR